MSKKVIFPAADRNKTPILEILQKHIPSDKEGKVLEISSGTGQHVSYFAAHFPKLIFQPSEYDSSLLPSISEYAKEIPTKNVKEPLHIDVRVDWKQWGVDNDYDYVININMIHVSPYECTEALFRNVTKILKPKGLLLTYGAYAHNGVIEPQSNIDFDLEIRRKNPSWGLRDIEDVKKIAKNYGIELLKIYQMPANNKCLIWEKN